jgi:hypothetical protein
MKIKIKNKWKDNKKNWLECQIKKKINFNKRKKNQKNDDQVKKIYIS